MNQDLIDRMTDASVANVMRTGQNATPDTVRRACADFISGAMWAVEECARVVDGLDPYERPTAKQASDAIREAFKP